MRFRGRTPASAALLTLLLTARPVARAQYEPPMTHVTPDEVTWSDSAEVPGLKIAVLAGDPRKAGPYTIRVKFPPGTMTRPHYHPEMRTVTVISGTWWAGAGDTFDPAAATPLAAGSFAIHFPKRTHFDGAKDDGAVVQISGIGPSATIWVHPEAGHVRVDPAPGRTTK